MGGMKDLFGDNPPPWHDRKAKADLSSARATGHAMAELCADRADKISDEWRARAFNAVVEFARSHERFVTEDVRAAYPNLAAHDDRAWGAVIRSAVKRGYVRAAGARPVKSSRGGYKTIWQRVF